MALSKPRKLNLDGTIYHWKASHHGNLHFAVRHPDRPKRKMVVNFSSHSTKITPWLVKKYINRALAEGWEGSKTYEHQLDSDS